METLNPAEARVLGSLLEKQVLTPDAYPLTLNYLVGACNQKTSREPVMQLEEAEVAAALVSLRKKMLAIENKIHDSRVLKYSHNILHLGSFTSKEQAALCLLLLRGPQTAGEIKSRSGRLADFESVGDTESALQSLAEKSCGPLAVKLPRRPGEKEARWSQLLTGPVEAGGPDSPVIQPGGLSARVTALEAEVAALKLQIQKLSLPPAP